MADIESFGGNGAKPALSVAIAGIRGVPARYGGFETFAEELSTRLVNRGHKVTVYCRPHVTGDNGRNYRGVDLLYVDAPQHKYLETPVHTLKCFIDIIRYRRKFDVLLVCNAANSPFLFLLRFAGIPVAVNVDGIERKRAKWNWVGRLWYRLGEVTSVLFANAVIADADVIADYYRETYRAKSVVIRYGYNTGFEELIQGKYENGMATGPLLEALENQPDLRLRSLEPGRYILYVSRLEPENHALTVIRAYAKLSPELRRFPLIIVGDAPYADEYKESLRREAPPEVIFCGFQFGLNYRLLQLCAGLYVQATEVGGTHPALVESMGFANCIVANGTPENREVLGDAGEFYSRNDADDLAHVLGRLLSDEPARRTLQRAALERAQRLYSWEKITIEYESLFNSLVGVGRAT